MRTPTNSRLFSSITGVGLLVGAILLLTFSFSEAIHSGAAHGVKQLPEHQIETVGYSLQHFATDPKGNVIGASASSLFRITEKDGRPQLVHRFGERINSVHVMNNGAIVVATDKDHWDPARPSLIYISTDEGRIFKLVKVINGGSALWWSIASDEAGRLFVGEYGPRENGHSKSVHMTADLGLTWSIVFSAPDNDKSHIHRVAVDPYTNDVWVTVGDGVRNRGAWRSRDSGATFTKVLDTQATAIAFTDEHIFFGEDRRQQPGITRLSRDTGKTRMVLDLAGDFDTAGSVYSLAFSASGALYASNMKYPNDDHTSSLWRWGPQGWVAIVNAPERPGGGAGFESIGGPDRFGYMYVRGYRIFDPQVR